MGFFLFSKIRIAVLTFAVSVIFFCVTAYSQRTGNDINFYNPNKKFSISVYGSFISSSQLQNNPKSSDPIEKNAMTSLKGGIGYGAELNFKPALGNLELTFFVSTEYF